MHYAINKENSVFIENTLFKYSSINQNLFSLLINNELWFSNPNDFNDPYDCNIHYDFSDVNYEKVYSHLLESNNKYNRGISIDNIRKRALEICNNPKGIEQLMSVFLKKTVDERGITCFSESDNTLLMWSHYADSHKGVCLTFDIDRDVNFFCVPYKVDYLNKYPKIDPFDSNSKKGIQLILATKSKEWQYEQEVRIIKEKYTTQQFRGPLIFNPECLTEIKFGYKTSEEQIKTVKNLAIKKYPHIKLYRSKIKTGSFGINFSRIM